MAMITVNFGACLLLQEKNSVAEEVLDILIERPHLELVGKIAREVNAVQDREEIFDQVVTLTVSLKGFTAAFEEAVAIQAE